MRRLALTIVVLLWPMTGQCEVTTAQQEGASNANARYRTYRHSRRHHRKHVVDDTAIRDDSSRARSGSARSVDFSVRHDPIRYPWTTGTSILDAFEGRRPAIDMDSCSNPWRDIVFTSSVDALAGN
jgi:hypothetical protein